MASICQNRSTEIAQPWTVNVRGEQPIRCSHPPYPRGGGHPRHAQRSSRVVALESERSMGRRRSPVLHSWRDGHLRARHDAPCFARAGGRSRTRRRRRRFQSRRDDRDGRPVRQPVLEPAGRSHPRERSTLGGAVGSRAYRSRPLPAAAAESGDQFEHCVKRGL
jgi:hypothetical protein